MSEYRQDEHTTAKEASKTHTDQSYRHNSWEEHEKRRYSFKEQTIKSMTLFFVVATCILFYFALLRLGQISSVFKQFLTVAKPIIYGLAIAYLLNPIVKWDDSAFGETLSQIKEEKTDIKRSWNLRICHLNVGIDYYTSQYDDSGVIWKYPRHDFQCAESDEPVYP